MDSSLETGEDTYVAKLNVYNKPLYLNVLWTNDDFDLFHITLFYDSESWTGKFSTELAAQRRERLDETTETYNTNVKECLSGNCKDYVYDFIQESDGATAKFIWKKRYEGALKIHGVVSLQKDLNPISTDTLIDILLQKNKKLISDVELASKTNNDLKQDLDEYIHKLEELTESKIALESALYGRFVQVLNEKKKRIRLLEEHIKSL